MIYFCFIQSTFMCPFLLLDLIIDFVLVFGSVKLSIFN